MAQNFAKNEFNRFNLLFFVMSPCRNNPQKEKWVDKNTKIEQVFVPFVEILLPARTRDLP
jgi:hypothetical protein